LRRIKPQARKGPGLGIHGHLGMEILKGVEFPQKIFVNKRSFYDHQERGTTLGNSEDDKLDFH
jgi:hypothetical protein